MSDDKWREIFSHVELAVRELLGNDASGHGFDHIERVRDLSKGFAAYYPEIDHKVVELAALLHDVDDYKLVGRQQAANQMNAVEIMTDVNIPATTQKSVKDIIANMGYSKSLRGIRPTTLEGMIVSDADMCDALGAGGIMRTLIYAVSEKGNGRLFDRDVRPKIDIAAHEYNSTGTPHDTDGFINHFFEKVLKLPTIMMTEPGRQEAAEREVVMIQFLRAYFREQNAPEWTDLLDYFLVHRETLAVERPIAGRAA